jgi:hypothetical protein
MALHLRAVLLPEGVERDLFVADGRITFEPLDTARTILGGGHLVPGLADVHAHLGLASPAPPDAPPEQRARASARAQLEAGVLAIREPGGPDRASTGIGPHEGLPRVSTGGRFLTPPGTYFSGLAREVPEQALPDAAEEEARASGAWAKVIGDWVGPGGAHAAELSAGDAGRGGAPRPRGGGANRDSRYDTVSDRGGGRGGLRFD